MRKKIYVRLLCIRFWLLNGCGRKPITDPTGPVVSLTSYGTRVKTVYLAIESIGRGCLRPSRIILWLDERACFTNPPATLRRLIRRGLEVKLCQNYGPHTKYYPFLDSESLSITSLVTADDDILYPRDWLKGLVESFLNQPHAVHCYRAHVVEVFEKKIVPYRMLKPCRNTEPNLSHFATGVSGVLYPVPFLIFLKQAGRGFEVCCPTNDDVWLHVHALRAGFPICQVGSTPIHFPGIPGTQNNALLKGNVVASENDRQIQSTYTDTDIQILLGNSLLRKSDQNCAGD